MTWICHHGDSRDTECHWEKDKSLLRGVKLVSVFLSFLGGPSRWLSSHCDCCCKSHKGEHEGESGTSFNELSTSCSETQSEASSPQGTVICGPIIRRPNAHTLDRPMPKGPVHMLQQAEMRRKTDMLRVRTFGVRDREAAKRKANKEKMTPEQELEKCIEDFRQIRIPDRFPERKNMWQSELLRKYHLWSSSEKGRCWKATEVTDTKYGHFSSQHDCLSTDKAAPVLDYRAHVWLCCDKHMCKSGHFCWRNTQVIYCTSLIEATEQPQGQRHFSPSVSHTARATALHSCF